MDLSNLTQPPPLTVARVFPDPDRRRLPDGRPTPDDLHPAFTLPYDNRFDSAAPVAVDAGTEAALVELKPVDGLPLDEAIHRYIDEI